MLMRRVCFGAVLLAASALAWTPSKTPFSLQRANADDRIATEVARNWQSRVQECRLGVACGLASALLLFSPLPSNAHQPMFPTTSQVAEVGRSVTATSTNPNPALLTSSQLLADSQSQQQQTGAILEEVWNLVDKYYIDRTFNGQDWNGVKETYSARLTKNGDEMKVVKDMVSTLNDKYSRMLDVQQYTAIQKYDLIGVGATLMPNKEKQIIVGAPPIAGSASDKAGLQVGDRVIKVNGAETKGRTAFDIIDQISEAPNAKTVTMTIQSVDDTDGKEIRDVVMDRQFQEIKNPVRYKITETRSDGTKVGYVRISEFNSLIKANLEDALRDLQGQGANAYVIDLRMNGGGAFQSAVEVSSFFYEDRVATYVVDGTSTVLPFKSSKGQVLLRPDDPVVIWVDGGSASASEVLAASLHDNCKAIVMGDKSFGKGLIQAVYGLKNGAGLVLTVAKYVTPNQGEIQGVGISPDISGKNILPPPLPGVGTDTSRVDFSDVRNRLSPNLCTVPEQQLMSSK